MRRLSEEEVDVEVMPNNDGRIVCDGTKAEHPAAAAVTNRATDRTGNFMVHNRETRVSRMAAFLEGLSWQKMR